MKIAVIANSASSLRNFRRLLLIELVGRGHDVLTFAPDCDDASREMLIEMGVEPVHCSMTRSGTNPVRELATIAELCRLLRLYKPDVCFAYFLKPVIYGTIAAWLAGVRCRYAMIEGLGFAFSERPGSNRRKILQKAIEILARFTMARVHRVIFLNRDDLDDFVERNLVAPEQTFLLGGIGVDLAEWPRTALPEGPITFIMVARLLREKGVREYVEAARLVCRTHPEAQFILVGGQDENPSTIPSIEIESWVADGLIKWPGHVEVRPWLAKAHVFVLPSYYREGVPRSTQEAMALGRPVITTDVPGCRDTVADGRNGFVVPPRDAAALAAAMRRFLDNPGLIAPMGAESRRIAEERFDAHVQNRKLLACLGID